jgi:transposase
MIGINTGALRILVHKKPADMRKSFDGLLGLARNVMNADPLQGALLVFFNRKRTMVKLLYFERGGFCIWHKRLEAGLFGIDWNRPCESISWLELQLLLEGAESRVIYRHKRLENAAFSGRKQYNFAHENRP